MLAISTNPENPTFNRVPADDGSTEYLVLNYQNPDVRTFLAKQAVEMGGRASQLQLGLLALSEVASPESIES